MVYLVFIGAGILGMIVGAFYSNYFDDRQKLLV